MLVKTKVLATAVALLAINFAQLPAAQGRTNANEVQTKGAIAIGTRYIGTPYCHGGNSPTCFDCSGFTQYVYKKTGSLLPHSANGQYKAVKRISKAKAKPGDLVFFMSHGNAYHVGIYVGNGKVLHSPKRGHKVRIERIWTSNVQYGRV